SINFWTSVGASIPPLSQIHSSGTSFFTQPESIRRSNPQPGVDLPQSHLCARVPGELQVLIRSATFFGARRLANPSENCTLDSNTNFGDTRSARFQRRHRSADFRHTRRSNEYRPHGNLQQRRCGMEMAYRERWQAAIAELQRILSGFDLREECKWGKPCYTIAGRNVVIIQGFKEYCALCFFQGALLKDPKKLLV